MKINRMKLSSATLFVVLWVWGFAAQSCLSAEDLHVSHEPQHHILKSRYVGQSYEITVYVPISKAGGSERFPVLYIPDGDFNQGMVQSTMPLQLGDVNRFIAVVIDYPEAARGIESVVLRTRDFTPTRVLEHEKKPLPNLEGIADIKSGKKSGGAREFLAFIREDVVPFIDQNYPTLPDDRGYYGNSFGGLFGLYILFNQPESFQRYIIGSPSIWWDNEVMFKQAQAFVKSGKPINAKVFIGGGDQETNTPEYNMVTNFYRLHGLLSSAKIPGLTLSFHVFPDETHGTVAAMSYVRGIREVYGKPVCPVFYSPSADKSCKK